MVDKDARYLDSLQPITQPQLPPSGVILARDTDLPGKVFQAKALLSRQASEQETLRVVEVCGDLGAECERSRASERSLGAVVITDPRGKADRGFTYHPIYVPAENQTGKGEASGDSR